MSWGTCFPHRSSERTAGRRGAFVSARAMRTRHLVWHWPTRQRHVHGNASLAVTRSVLSRHRGLLRAPTVSVRVVRRSTPRPADQHHTELRRRSPRIVSSLSATSRIRVRNPNDAHRKTDILDPKKSVPSPRMGCIRAEGTAIFRTLITYCRIYA